MAGHRGILGFIVCRLSPPTKTTQLLPARKLRHSSSALVLHVYHLEFVLDYPSSVLNIGAHYDLVVDRAADFHKVLVAAMAPERVRY